MKNLYYVAIYNNGELISDDGIRYIEGFKEAKSVKKEWEKEGFDVSLCKMNKEWLEEELKVDEDARTYYSHKPIKLWLNK